MSGVFLLVRAGGFLATCPNRYDRSNNRCRAAAALPELKLAVIAQTMRPGMTELRGSRSGCDLERLLGRKTMEVEILKEAFEDVQAR